MIKPEPGYVLLEVIDYDNKIGSFVIPQSEKEKTNIGEVIKDGGLTRDELLDHEEVYFQPGTRVIFERWGGMTLENENQILIERKKIFAVVEGEYDC